MNAAQAARRDPPAAPFVPYTVAVADGVVRLRDRSLATTIRLEGYAHEAASAQAVETLHHQLAETIRRVGSEHVSFWFHMDRHETDERSPGHCRPSFAAWMDAALAEKVEAARLLVTDYYVSVVWRPYVGRGGRLGAWVNAAQRAADDADALARHAAVVDEMMRSLAAYRPTMLAEYPGTHATCSKQLEFYRYLLAGDRVPVAVPADFIFNALVDHRPLAGPETVRILQAASSHLVGALGVHEVAAETAPGMLDQMLTLAFPFVLTLSFECLDKQRAVADMRRHYGQLLNAGDAATSLLVQLQQAIDAVASGQLAAGLSHCDVVVRAPDEATLRRRMGAAQAALQYPGMKAPPHTSTCWGAIWAQLPGNAEFIARRAPITSRNTARMMAPRMFPSGHRTTRWGPALAMTLSASGGPAYLNVLERDSDRGHTLIVGANGSGKTVLAGLIAMMLDAKAGARGVVLDKDRGLEIAIRAQGGRYYALEPGVDTGWQLFACEGSRRDVARVTDLLVLLARLEMPGMAVTPAERAQLDFGVARVFDQPLADRSIANLLSYLPSILHEPSGIAARLARWSRGQPMGWVLDCASHTLTFADGITGFDVTEFLDHPELRTPVAAYLFGRIPEMLRRGQPFFFLADEFSKLLDDEFFAARIKNFLKTLRKLDGVFIGATQQAADIGASSIGRTIVGECATQYLFANLEADREDYCGTLKRSEREFEIVRTLSPASRRVLVCQQGQSFTADLGLAHAPDVIDVISGRGDTVRLLDAIRAEVGDDPAAWLPIFQRRARELRR